MPIYEYYCAECGTIAEGYRPIAKRDVPRFCSMKHKMERIYSVPALSVWDADRSFPNAVKSGEGKFPTRAAYESHLKANNMAEAKTDGKIKRPHGNRVISRF